MDVSGPTDTPRTAGGRREAGRLRAALRRLGPLGVVAIVGAPLLVLCPLYVWQATFLTGIVNDFIYYHEAAVRFLADPGTLYADPNYMYPPPSVLAFVPFAGLSQEAGYAIMAVLTLAATALVVGLFARLVARATGRPLDRATWAAVAVVAFASSPLWQTVKMGQVSVLVLAVALGAVYLAERRPVWAGLALAGGFWLKVYPLALAPLGLRERGRWWMALGFGLGLAALPVLLLPLVPAGLYADYRALMGDYGGLTNPGSLNEGLPAVLLRLVSGPDLFTTYRDWPQPPFVRVVSAAVTVLLGGLVAGAYLRGRLRAEPAAFAMLAAVAAVSSYGWECTYVMALPLLWWVLLEARAAGKGMQAVALVLGLTFLVPKPPDPFVDWTVHVVPRPLPDLFYARHLLATLVLLALVLVEAWRPARAVEQRIAG